ncbi:TPA: amidophosphoribosyltransferase, partial [Campylobacter jejuni]|nr:amidophosphoribosyltransferase [Campylobacter jejuni]HEF6231223.1 amidophosphoribosyltransferase [Campylobacter jejuni]
KDRFIESLKECIGAYCFVLASKDKLYVVRDPHGVRPLSLGRLKDGGYIVASETCAFDLIEAEFIRDVKPGEMLIFTQGNDKFESIELFSQTPRICAFEYIYFARPDSIVEGKSVYEVRKKMGEALAKKFAYKADFVVPVPDSGVSAAIGFAQYLQIPLEMAIVRNHYVGRTFIEPTQELRNLKVKLKLNPMRKVLEGKEIVVIDDSLVRGTTSKKIISLLRAAGASKIHLAIACPEIKFPDTYGIDTPTFEELISANKNAEEVREYVEADTLSFLSIEELTQSIGDERKYSLISFDGDYFIK